MTQHTDDDYIQWRAGVVMAQVRGRETVPAEGRWVPTFANDIQAGDRIRRDGVERYVLGRSYPPSFFAKFAVEYTTGAEPLRKLDLVEIWDPDGSVSQRVMDLSAQAAGSGGDAARGYHRDDVMLRGRDQVELDAAYRDYVESPDRESGGRP